MNDESGVVGPYGPFRRLGSADFSHQGLGDELVGGPRRAGGEACRPTQAELWITPAELEAQGLYGYPALRMTWPVRQEGASWRGAVGVAGPFMGPLPR